MIQKHWWKALSVLILLYVFIAGMLLPLNSGIYQVTPSSNLRTGTSAILNINTYNTNYDSNSKVRAWIKISDSHAIPAVNVKAIDDQNIEATFDIPRFLPTNKTINKYPLILDDAENGAFVRPSQIGITQELKDSVEAVNTWAYAPISNLNIKKKYSFPFRTVLYETIRNTYFHVPLWFGMTIIFFIATIYGIKYLRNFETRNDLLSVSFTTIGVIYGLLGCATGAIWAKSTWGTWWTLSEVKLNVSAIAMLIYLAYFVLRNSFDDEEKRARISAVYSIFAFVAMVPLLFVIPRMMDGSLHPGNGGNPGFGGEDLDNTMRMVFYPAIIGWTLFGVWLSNLLYRAKWLEYRLDDDE